MATITLDIVLAQTFTIAAQRASTFDRGARQRRSGLLLGSRTTEDSDEAEQRETAPPSAGA